MSSREPCGVRDHGRLLGEALARPGTTVDDHWLTRRRLDGFAAARAEVHGWIATLARELADERPDAVILHYSVFSYAHKGIPLFVRPVLAALRPLRAPLVNVMHEFAYPWRLGGWRGTAWAVSQRAVLRDLVRASDGVLVTTDERAEYLRSRPWLPRRPVSAVPVFSNLPPAAPGAAPSGARDVIGLFGYSYQSAAVGLILDSLSALRAGGRDVELRLLGAPGPESEAGRGWLAAAEARGIADAISFTGPMPGQALSDELASCMLLLFGDAIGPSSRKGSLAAALASGRPVVAIDGSQTWPALVHRGAARVVAPGAPAMAEAIGELLDDAPAREALGARGRAFYFAEMDVTRTAAATLELLELCVQGR